MKSIGKSVLWSIAILGASNVYAAQQMRVGFTDTCPVSQKSKESALAGIGAAIVVDVAGRLVANAVDALSQYLTNDKATTYSANGRMNAFAVQDANGNLTISPNEACVVVVIGTTFNTALSDTERSKLPQLQGVPDSVASATRTISKATGLTSGLSFYFEGVLQPDKIADGAFTLIPKYWYYPKFLGVGGWQYKQTRDVLFKIELSPPGGKAFASWDMQWQGVGEGSISTDEVADKVIQWAPYPDGLTKLKQAGYLFPVNANVLLTETQQPYTIVKYVGQALAAQKDQITSDVKSSLDLALSQQARLDARKAALSDVDTKYKAYTDAYAAAKTAYDTYSKAADSAAKAQALIAARIAYDKLDLASTELRLAYQAGSLGPAPDLPALTPLPT